MATISIDPQQAINYGAKIVEEANQFKGEIKAVYAIVNDLKAVWTGSAAQRFTDKIEGFQAEYENFAQQIENFGSLLKAIGQDYKDLEDSL